MNLDRIRDRLLIAMTLACLILMTILLSGCRDNTSDNQSGILIEQERPEETSIMNQTIIAPVHDDPDIVAIDNQSESAQQSDQDNNQQQDIPGEYDLTLEHDGLTRSFFVYIPETEYKEKARPIVFNFHGGLGNGKQQCDMSNIEEVADKYGFIAVCPDGTSNQKGRAISKSLLYWNDGQLETPAQMNGVDDVGFVIAMIEDLDSRFNIDRKKVYSTGISNGAILSHRLACEISDKITAIAPIAGSICNMSTYCSPGRHVPIMMFNGLQDTNVPYEGGLGSGFAGYIFPPVSYSVEFWIEKNGLTSNPSSGKIGQYARYDVYGSEEETQVILWTLEDGGHTWPSGDPLLSEKLLGNVNEDISASEEMWKFFDRYCLD